MDLWLLCGLGVVVALLIANALDERRQHLKMAHRVEAMEQRFRDGGIDLADTMSTDVKITEKWTEWDDDVPPDDRRPVNREMWRE